MAAIDLDVNRMKRSDQVIAVCGVVLFLCLFLAQFKVSSSLEGGSQSISKGFFGWLPLWLGFLVGGLAFFPSLGIAWPAQIPFTRTIAIAGLSVLALVILLLRSLKKPGLSGVSSAQLALAHVSVGRTFGLFLGLIALIVQVVFAVMAFRESGEALPDLKKIGNNLGGGSDTPAPGSQAPGAYPPPPAPGSYPPPPAQGGGYPPPPSA